MITSHLLLHFYFNQDRIGMSGISSYIRRQEVSHPKNHDFPFKTLVFHIKLLVISMMAKIGFFKFNCWVPFFVTVRMNYYN